MMENDDAHQKFNNDHKIRTRYNRTQQSQSLFTENKIKNPAQENSFRNLRSQNRILTTAQQNRFIPNTNKQDYVEISYNTVARRGRKPQNLLNDRDRPITLWRVPDRSNVFTVIGTPNKGFVPVSYSAVVAGNVTRNNGQAVSYPSLQSVSSTPHQYCERTYLNSIEKMGNLLRTTENLSNTVTTRSNPATEKRREEPALKVEETVTSAKNKNKGKGWIKVINKKKRKPKHKEPVKDSPIIYPESRNTVLLLEMPMKQAVQVVPEKRSNSSRMKIKRDLRKMRAKMRKQEGKFELITKPKESAQNPNGKNKNSDEHRKSKPAKDQRGTAPISKDENDGDKGNEQDKTTIKNKKRTQKKNKKKKSIKEPVVIEQESSAPAKIKNVKEAVTVGTGKKPKKGPKNKKLPPTPTEVLDLPSTSKQPDTDKGQDDAKITVGTGTKPKKGPKNKKLPPTPTEVLDLPSTSKRPDKYKGQDDAKITNGTGKKTKKGPKNKKLPPTPTEVLDLPSASKQPDTDKGQDDAKITKGKRNKKLMKNKKHNSTSDEMDLPLSVRNKHPEKETPIQTKSPLEESKPTCIEESQGAARKSRPTKANRNKGKSVDKSSNIKAKAEEKKARKRRPKLCWKKKVST